MATKGDIEALKSGTKGDIEELKAGISGLGERLARLEERTGFLLKASIAFNVPLLVAVIGILLRLVFA